MNIRLKIFLVLLCLLFDINLYSKVINKKLDFKLGLSWFFVSIGLILSTIFDNVLMLFKDFLGFEILSNMIFLIGFGCLSLITLSLSMKLCVQNEKIVKLTQELALLKKEKDNENN
ncbi:MAG: DUF2304 domain-containing protein [Bacilli bacterium]|nr:DUF2304 domain-containing protein [Bacilli bacterium]